MEQIQIVKPESYIKLKKTGNFIDRTLLIKDVIDGCFAAILFLRPFGSGKSIALDMLKTYFEKSDQSSAVFFKDTKIWTLGEEYQVHQGKYTVISLSFKEVRTENYQACVQNVNEMVRREFDRHPEIYTFEQLTVFEKVYVQKVQNDELTEVELFNGLLILSQILDRIYGVPAIILIDDVDTPFALPNTEDDIEREKIENFLLRFLACGLKDNAALHFGILTGVKPLPLFDGLDNLVVDVGDDFRYCHYYGFTE